MIIFTKFHEDLTKIVDFQLMAKFLMCPSFFSSDFKWYPSGVNICLHFLQCFRERFSIFIYLGKCFWKETRINDFYEKKCANMCYCQYILEEREREIKISRRFLVKGIYFLKKLLNFWFKWKDIVRKWPAHIHVGEEFFSCGERFWNFGTNIRPWHLHKITFYLHFWANFIKFHL